MNTTKSKKNFQKGEIATIIALGTMAFILVTSVVSTFIAKKPQTTSTKAADSCECNGEGCKGSRWCGNDCKWHDENNQQCSLDKPKDTPKPTESNTQSGCECNGEGCHGSAWCGNDCKWHTENNYKCSDEAKKPTPTLATKSSDDPCLNCSKKEQCVNHRWCGNDCKYYDTENIRRNCVTPTPTSKIESSKSSSGTIPTPTIGHTEAVGNYSQLATPTVHTEGVGNYSETPTPTPTIGHTEAVGNYSQLVPSKSTSEKEQLNKFSVQINNNTVKNKTEDLNYKINQINEIKKNLVIVSSENMICTSYYYVDNNHTIYCNDDVK